MATGRTVSANQLTNLDQKVLNICEQISNSVSGSLYEKSIIEEFKSTWGKVHYSRDAGTGRGAGKLQRDSLCTRGRGGKAPFSNRNLRWHPLVVANQPIPYFKRIEKVEVKGKNSNQLLSFFITNKKGQREEFDSNTAHLLGDNYYLLPDDWENVSQYCSQWSDELWTKNSCVIPITEFCYWWQAVETFAALTISIGCQLFGLKFDEISGKLVKILNNQSIDSQVSLPSPDFSQSLFSLTKCPICLFDFSKSLDEFRNKSRGTTWQPNWSPSKRSEGEDSSIQLMHLDPLSEIKINHNAKNVRYGHRWCNVLMTDHSLDETLKFLKHIVDAQSKGQN